MKKTILILASVLMTSQAFSNVVAEYDCGRKMMTPIKLVISKSNDNSAYDYEGTFDTDDISPVTFTQISKTIKLEGSLDLAEKGGQIYFMTDKGNSKFHVQADVVEVGERATVKELTVISPKKMEVVKNKCTRVK